MLRVVTSGWLRQKALKKIIVVQVDEAEQAGLDRLENDVERRVGGKADMAYEPFFPQPV